MKKTFLFFFFLSKIVLAQELQNKIVYLDSLYMELNSNKLEIDSLNIKVTQDHYKYYRVVKDYYLNKKEYLFTQYYNSDKIESKGVSGNKDYYFKKGEIISYYENGTMKSKINYSDNLKSGECTFWYENGNKRLEGEFILNKAEEIPSEKLKIFNSWDINDVQNVKDGIGNYTETGEESLYSKNKKPRISLTGKIKDGFKDGLWIGKDVESNFTFEENYENGILISGTSTDKNNEKHVYTTIGTPSSYIGGIASFYTFLQQNLNPPDIPGLKGKVISSFTIDENGMITNLKIVRSLQPNADAEVLRVLKKCHGFSPAVLRGIKIKSNMVLPIAISNSD